MCRCTLLPKFKIIDSVCQRKWFNLQILVVYNLNEEFNHSSLMQGRASVGHLSSAQLIFLPPLHKGIRRKRGKKMTRQANTRLYQAAAAGWVMSLSQVSLRTERRQSGPLNRWPRLKSCDSVTAAWQLVAHCCSQAHTVGPSIFFCSAHLSKLGDVVTGCIWDDLDDEGGQ